MDVRRLILFDVDGTLTQSSTLDAAAFLRAVEATFELNGIKHDWSSYRHVTGAGVLREIIETRLRRLPTNEEIGRFQEYLTASVRAGIAEAGGIKPVLGAAQLLARLLDSPSKYAVALASGNWAAIARLLLYSAGLRVEGVLGAFSDDALAREDICRTARQRAEQRHECVFSRVVYVGDGVWDVRAAQALGYGFVGIGQDAAEEKLRLAGAAEVQPDFQDVEAFLAAVERAAATVPPASSQTAGTAASAH